MAEPPGLAGCALYVPEESRIPNYQLLAPQLSHDGKYLAYETLISERRELHISDTGTWARHRIRPRPNELFQRKEAFESELDWLPAAGMQNWYVFVTGDRNNFDIFLGDASQAQKPIPLITSEKNDHQPVFSPDGRDLLFISTKDRSEGTDLYVVLDVAKKIQDPAVEIAPIRLTTSETGVLYPAWSPDGKSITMTIEQTENGVLNDGISILDFGAIRDGLTPGEDATSKAKIGRVTAPEVAAEFGRYDEVGASWSPDGAYIAFYLSEHTGGRRAAKKDERVQHNLGLVRVNRGSELQFSNVDRVPLVQHVLDPNADSFLRGPEWTSDSRWIVTAKDSPEEQNPIRVLAVPSGEAKEMSDTKLNRDLFVTHNADGAAVVLFSAHDRQSTSVYRCELR